MTNGKVKMETKHSDHRLAITQFVTRYRTWGHCGLTTWGDFLQWATTHTERPLEERDGPGFVPGYLTAEKHRTDIPRPEWANAYRNKENVRINCIFAIDQDDGTPLEQLAPMLLPFEWVAYTTHRHTQGHPRFRVLLPLKQPVLKDDWPGFWAGAINHFTGDAMARVTADTQVKDAGRFYWWPVRVPGAEHWIHHGEGALLDPKTIARSTPWVVKTNAKTPENSATQAWRDGQPIAEGTRDNTLRDIARYLCGIGHDESTIYQEAKRINRAQCQPPYEGAEEEEVCRRVARGAIRRFLPDEDTPIVIADDEAI